MYSILRADHCHDRSENVGTFLKGRPTDQWIVQVRLPGFEDEYGAAMILAEAGSEAQPSSLVEHFQRRGLKLRT
jgi:hypothetical protein